MLVTLIMAQTCVPLLAKYSAPKTALRGLAHQSISAIALARVFAQEITCCAIFVVWCISPVCVVSGTGRRENERWGAAAGGRDRKNPCAPCIWWCKFTHETRGQTSCAPTQQSHLGGRSCLTHFTTLSLLHWITIVRVGGNAKLLLRSVANCACIGVGLVYRLNSLYCCPRAQTRYLVQFSINRLL